MSEIVDPFDQPVEEDAPVGPYPESETHGDEEETPPEPDEVPDIRDMPLAQREAFKLAGMTPEQRARYDAAQAEIMSHPAVQSFAASEELHDIKMATYREEFRKALKQKEKK